MREILDYDAWVERFKPIQNPNHDGPGSYENTLFDTYGDDQKFVQRYGHEHVWTLVENDGEQTILSGPHLVNRTGFFITEVSHNRDTKVRIEDLPEWFEALESPDNVGGSEYRAVYDTIKDGYMGLLNYDRDSTEAIDLALAICEQFIEHAAEIRRVLRIESNKRGV